jgi:hypothetical protein
MSMVMADDEDSDFVANDAEQEVIREPILKVLLDAEDEQLNLSSGPSAR